VEVVHLGPLVVEHVDIVGFFIKMSTGMSKDYFDRRLKAAIEMYRKGNTLQEIGSVLNVTRERIRQILKKAGLSSADGGVAVRGLLRLEDERKKRAAKIEKRERWARKLFGCSFENYLTLGNWKDTKSPAWVYFSARRNAQRRNIPWEFTLPSWWDLWQRSGYWYLRGSPRHKINKGRFVMARYGDTGPYSPDNVRIIEWGENSRECQQVQRSLGRPAFGGKHGQGVKLTHCKRGHELTPENLYAYKDGSRVCKKCDKIRKTEYYKRRTLKGANATV